MTYARRYSYMAALGLVADEDDDGNAASQAPKQVFKAPPVAPKPVEEPTLTPMQQAARQDLRDAFSQYQSRWAALSDSEKNAEGAPPMLEAEFRRLAREAMNADVKAGLTEAMMAFTARLEGMAK